MHYPDIPSHVRLVEKSGNERTITVALSTLDDPRQWTPAELKTVP